MPAPSRCDPASRPVPRNRRSWRRGPAPRGSRSPDASGRRAPSRAVTRAGCGPGCSASVEACAPMMPARGSCRSPTLRIRSRSSSRRADTLTESLGTSRPALRHRALVELHHRLAVRGLVARRRQRIQGERVLVGRGEGLLDQRTERTHAHRVERVGREIEGGGFGDHRHGSSPGDRQERPGPVRAHSRDCCRTSSARRS